MEFRCIPQDLASALSAWTGDTLVVGLFASGDSNAEDPRRQVLANLFGDELLQRLEQRQFKAKPGESASLERLGASPQTLILVGLGEAKEFDLAALRMACAAGARAACSAGAKDLALCLPTAGLGAGAAARAMAEAVRLSLFQDQRFKSKA